VQITVELYKCHPELYSWSSNCHFVVGRRGIAHLPTLLRPAAQNISPIGPAAISQCDHSLPGSSPYTSTQPLFNSQRMEASSIRNPQSAARTRQRCQTRHSHLYVNLGSYLTENTVRLQQKIHRLMLSGKQSVALKNHTSRNVVTCA